MSEKTEQQVQREKVCAPLENLALACATFTPLVPERIKESQTVHELLATYRNEGMEGVALYASRALATEGRTPDGK